MASDIEQTYQNLRRAVDELSQIIDDSDYVEYELVGVKMKLLKAEYHFMDTYLAELKVNTYGRPL